MGVTPNLGIQYPDASGVPSRKSWVEDPLKSVDAQVVAYLAKRWKSGEGSVTIPVGQAFQDVSVTFGSAFASAPRAFAIPRTTDAYRATTRVKSTTGATFRIFRPAGAPTTAAATVPFDWEATDMGNA